LTIGQDKKNKYWLDSLIYNIKDEQRAYDIGGTTQRFYQELMGTELSEKAAKSELCAKLYSEALQVLKQEKKHMSQNILRTKLKLKPKYASETKLLKKAQIEFVFNKIVECAEKSGKKVDIDSMWKNSKELLKQIQPIGKKAVSEGRQDFNNEEWQEMLEITLKVIGE
jgi:DNA polymerase I-like protein with 3'-5' exonuclease and polymerase domains